MENVLFVSEGKTRHPMYRMNEPVNFSLGVGEQLAIVGDNASGKSLLVGILLGRYPLLQNEVSYHFPNATSKMVSDNVKYMAFRDSYGDADATAYYQQRWNAMEQDDFDLTRDLLPAGDGSDLDKLLFELLELADLMDKPIIQLSSGEMRKFQLAKVLLAHPSALILDNPFIGLDQATRVMLHGLFDRLIKETSLQLVLVLSKPDEIPDFVTHVVPVKDKVCGNKMSREAYLATVPCVPTNVLSDDKRNRILNLKATDNQFANNEIVRLNKVVIRYGDRVILNELDWTVSEGECWALTGTNGSGKSTLLSLIYADNPQSYACDIALFGRKRGTGESIWDIKKHIGYVSPEMHRSYLKNLPAIDIVASGLHDSIGLYKKVHEEERNICRWWMEIFGIEKLADRNYLQLSSGEQRLVLLARSFVKDPALLILDEPMHGLDLYQRQLVKNIIEVFCKRKGKTLIMVTHYPEELPCNITHTLTLQKAKSSSCLSNALTERHQC